MKTKQEVRDKKLLALHREWQQLNRRSREKAAVEPPVQKGWMRCYFLTAAAEQQPDAPILRSILQEINEIRYHWKRLFVPTRRFRRAQIQQFLQPLKPLKPSKRLGTELPEAWRKYFVREQVFDGWRWLDQWRFIKPELVELRIVPRMVKELPVCDPEKESRIAEIDAVLDDPRLSGRLRNLRGVRGWHSRGDMQTELAERVRRRIRAAYEGDVEAEKAPAGLVPFPPQHFFAHGCGPQGGCARVRPSLGRRPSRCLYRTRFRPCGTHSSTAVIPPYTPTTPGHEVEPTAQNISSHHS